MTSTVRTLPAPGGPTSSAVFFAVEVHTTDGWAFVHAFRESPVQIAQHVDALSRMGLGQFAYRQATAAEIESEGVL